MTNKHWLGSVSSRGRKPARRARQPLAVEVLERRLAPASAPGSLHFDGNAASLSLVGTTAEVRGLNGGGLAVTLDGHLHSSDVGSASFDPALAGASAAGLRQISLDGGSPADSLTLGTLLGSGTLAVRSDGSVSVAGTVRAAGLSVTASGLLDVAPAGRLASPGGAISLVGGQLVNSGSIDAGGSHGGQVAITAGDYLDAGLVSAAGGSGAGGQVRITFSHSYIDTATATTTASGSTGGQISVGGGGRLFSSGRFLATGTSGGSINLLGQDVLLMADTINASGTAGAGGRVVAWSQSSTLFRGSVTARGDGGGFIEVSSSGQLDYGGKANAGQGGTLLLDPKNLVILKGTGGTFPQFNLVNPGSGGAFGTTILTLATGNVVVTDPKVNSNKGAVYLFDGRTGALISTLSGSTNGDQVGSGGVTGLTNGNFVVSSPSWSSARGAATWGSGNTGVSGVVSSANSFVGTTSSTDQVSSDGVTALTNGNYVVDSSQWGTYRGAVTWGNGTTGTSGTVSGSNSLVGTATGFLAGDHVGSKGVIALANGNYVVRSPKWTSSEGAATWGDGSGGTAGAVSASNSLVGSSTGSSGDKVSSGGVIALPGGNYVVVSPIWNNSEGAVTWGPGASGVIGLIDSGNSLVGSTAGTNGDQVGSGGVTVLTNGNYVVSSPLWNGSRGAATWGSGTTGVSGDISSTSLVGSSKNDQVSSGGVTALTNGNYVVDSPSWGPVTFGRKGAVTWGDGTTGLVDTVSATNSLIGGQFGGPLGPSGDAVGNAGVTALPNGNYVVQSTSWHTGTGAATWVDGSAMATGTVSASNSIVGSSTSDSVGTSVTPLSNGNYVVASPLWSTNKGAVTWGSGTAVTSEVVSSSNSLVGSTNGDHVGNGGVTALTDGNYVVLSPLWSSKTGAATWENGTGSVGAAVSATNSLVGSTSGTSGDEVGSGGAVALPDGNYVVFSPLWNNSRGAATWGNGSTGTSGTVGSSNSLVGTTGGSTGDQVGSGGVTVLVDGNLVVSSPNWSTSTGAVTWLDASTGTTLDGQGSPDSGNSLLGSATKAGLVPVQLGAINGSFVAGFPTDPNGGRVTVGFVPSGGSGNGELSYGFDPSQTITESPDVIAETLAAGTSVVLQANDDITVSSPITVVSQGTPGNLSLDAGRSILLNAGINTAGGNLTLLANDSQADGVVDSQRDPGNAAITMGSGVNLVTGAGNLSVDLKTSTDKTNNGKGVATLQVLSAGLTTLSNTTVVGVTIDGPTPGDGVTTGTYTQTTVSGPINLNGATLAITHVVATSVGEMFTIVHSTGGVSGTFAGLPEGADITANDGTPYQISYQGNGGQDVVLTQGTSPTQLQITTQPPVSVTAGAPFSLAVSVEDAQGNVANGFTGTVTLALAANPNGDTLSGNLSVQAQNGVANFTGLSLDKAASGITFQATCANLAPATTSPAISVTAGSAKHLVVATGLPGTLTAGVVVSPALVIDVVDLFGNIVTTDSSSVTIAVATGPGAVGGTLTEAAVNGVATFSDLVFDTAGSYSLRASDSDSTLTGATTNTATVLPGPPSYIGFVGQVGTGLAGQVLTGVVVDVYDQYNNVVTTNNTIQVTISIASGPANASFTANSTLTVKVLAGVATFSNLTLDSSGTYTFAISATGGLSGNPSSDVTVNPGTADHLAFNVQPSPTDAGNALTPGLQVEVVDQNGNRVSSDNTDQVTVAVASGPGAFTGSSTLTVPVQNGVAAFDNLVLDTAGNYSLSVSSSSGLKGNSTASVTILPLAPDHFGYGPVPASAKAGAALAPALTVQLFDTFGNLTTNDVGDQVTITVASGPGTFTAGSTTTVPVLGGVATFSNLVLTVAGSYTFTFSSSSGLNGSPASGVTIVPAAPQHLAFLQQPTDSTAGSAIAPPVTVQLLDLYGNPESSDSSDRVTITVNSGPGNFTSGSTRSVVVSGGVATFGNLVLTAAGSYSLSATGPGAVSGPASASFTVAPGAADHLAFAQQPANGTAGAVLGKVTVQVQDQYDNPVNGDNGDQLTVSLASGPANATFDASSTFTATVGNGVATFDKLILDKVGPYTLSATGILSSPASNSFTISPAAADHLEFQGTPGPGAAGQALPGVSVGVFDRFENLLTGDFTDQVTVAVATGPGTFPTGSTTSVTVSSGVAAFGNLVLTKPGQYTLSATAGNLKGPASGAFQVSPGTANQLVFSAEPADTTAGVALNSTGTAVTVQVLDQFGNLLSGDNSDQVTLGASGPGGFTANSKPTLTVSGGVAVFNNLVLNTAGAYTLGVSSGSITGLASSSFHVNPAAADHLSPPIQQPTGRVTAGALLEVQLAVEDQFNNVVTSDNSTVSVALAGNPSGVTLGGTLKQQAVAGIATFNDLTISGAGTFSIQASDSNPAVASTTTNPFEVDQLKLSSTAVLEFRPDGTLVGSLGVQGGSGHTYHYALIMGASSPDARSFSLSGNQLLTSDAFDLAAKSSYSVKLRATDETGHTVDQVFTITVQADPHLNRSGKTLTVTGTKGKDTFSFSPGGVQDSLTLNGTRLAVDTASVSKIVLQGGGGSDSMTLTGSSGSDTFTGSKGSSTLSGKGYAVTALGFAAVNVNGGKGTDRAILSVSTSGNAFVGKGGSATLGGSGYSIVLTGVEDVTLSGKAGTRNTIHLAQIAYKLHQSGVWVKV